MDLPAELAHFKVEPAPGNGILDAVRKLADPAQEAARQTAQIARRDTEWHAARIKIQALTRELAPLRRMRFGARSEALSAEQRDLFQETRVSDLAGERHLRSMRQGLGQNWRRHQRTAGGRAGSFLRASAHSSAVRLSRL